MIAHDFIPATGQMQHHFSGEYCADIWLIFSADVAPAAHHALGPGWRVAPLKDGRVALAIRARGVVLDAVIAQLESWRTAAPCARAECKGKQHPIDGLEHSSDYGPVFEVRVPVVNPNQLALFAA